MRLRVAGENFSRTKPIGPSAVGPFARNRLGRESSRTGPPLAVSPNEATVAAFLTIQTVTPVLRVGRSCAKNPKPTTAVPTRPAGRLNRPSRSISPNEANGRPPAGRCAERSQFPKTSRQLLGTAKLASPVVSAGRHWSSSISVLGAGVGTLVGYDQRRPTVNRPTHDPTAAVFPNEANERRPGDHLPERSQSANTSGNACTRVDRAARFAPRGGFGPPRTAFSERSQFRGKPRTLKKFSAFDDAGPSVGAAPGQFSPNEANPPSGPSSRTFSERSQFRGKARLPKRLSAFIGETSVVGAAFGRRSPNEANRPVGRAFGPPLTTFPERSQPALDRRGRASHA